MLSSWKGLGCVRGERIEGGGDILDAMPMAERMQARGGQCSSGGACEWWGLECSALSRSDMTLRDCSIYTIGHDLLC